MRAACVGGSYNVPRSGEPTISHRSSPPPLAIATLWCARGLTLKVGNKAAAFIIVTGCVRCSGRPMADAPRNPSTGTTVVGMPTCNEPDRSPPSKEDLPAAQMGSASVESDLYAHRLFSGRLRALGQPRLLDARDNETYRLLMEGDGGRQVVAISAQPGSIQTSAIERLPDTVIQLSEVGYVHGEYGPRPCHKRALSASDWSRIRDCFEAKSFWTAPASPLSHMFDSPYWTAEARRQERYHFVVRSGGVPTPERNKDGFIECARLLIDLSGVDLTGL